MVKDKNQNMVALGHKGGKARAKKLSAEERHISASEAARARWDRQKLDISVLLLREDAMWAAQCLEYDLAAQGRTLAEVKEAFRRTFTAQIMVDLHYKLEPLVAFQAAPSWYWNMFQNADQFTDWKLPSFMIHATWCTVT